MFLRYWGFPAVYLELSRQEKPCWHIGCTQKTWASKFLASENFCRTTCMCNYVVKFEKRQRERRGRLKYLWSWNFLFNLWSLLLEIKRQTSPEGIFSTIFLLPCCQIIWIKSKIFINSFNKFFWFFLPVELWILT